MNRKGIFAVWILLFCGLSVMADDVKPYTLEELDQFTRLERLSPRVVVVRNGVSDMDTVAAVATARGVVVIDAGTNTPRSLRYREQIEKELGRRDFVYLIQTHFHRDHSYGNRAFPEAAVIGHERLAGELQDRWASDYDSRDLSQARLHWQKQLQGLSPGSNQARQLRIYLYEADEILAAQAQGQRGRLPDISFSDRMTLDMGDVTVQLIYFGPAHTQSDILVYLPQEDLLFVGDLFNAPGDINFEHFGHQYARTWTTALETVTARSSAGLRVVNGHFGRTMGAETLLEFAAAMKTFATGYEAGKEPYPLRRITRIEAESGLDGLRAELTRLEQADKDKFFFLENPLITAAYAFMLNGKVDRAIELLRFVCRTFPQSWNAFDSLGEAYMRSSDREGAIENYEKSLKLNPQNQNAVEQLKKLRES